MEAGTLTHATDVAKRDTGRTTAQIIGLECPLQTDRGWLTGMGHHQQSDQLKGVTHNTHTRLHTAMKKSSLTHIFLLSTMMKCLLSETHVTKFYMPFLC